MTPTLAVVFPGQGSQSMGMLGDINESYPVVQTIFKEASDVLGYDLWNLTQDGPQEKLDQTFYTQPALLTAAYAIWQIIQTHKPLKPMMMAGHSLGEYTALVASDALPFREAVKIVAARGAFMQEAIEVGSGAMGAIVGLDEAKLQTICETARQSDEVLSAANFNSPGQTVIAGHTQSVEHALEQAKEAGARLAIRLAVSVPSHCLLMEEASKRLASLLETVPFRTPTLPVLSNATKTIYDSPASIREGLVKQLYSPVHWIDTIQKFITRGINTVIEVGPGKVLTGLNKRIDPNLNLYSTGDLTNLEVFLKSEDENWR